MEYELIDCCPVPKPLADELRVLKADSGCTYVSVYRGTDARALLAQCGKKDQAQLYAMFLAGTGNPANPPGRSTHELRSDGVAFEGPVGRQLEYWQVGIDVGIDRRDALIAAARERGWIVTVTYPTSSLERHHVNFRREPDFQPFDPLVRGEGGDRVRRLIEVLCFVHRPRDRGGRLYLEGRRPQKFDADVESAVRQFQSDHELDADGVVGKHTWQQMLVAERAEKQERQVQRLKVDLRGVERDLSRARSDRRSAEARDDRSTVKRMDAQIERLGDKAAKLRDQIRELGGNPATPPVER